MERGAATALAAADRAPAPVGQHTAAGGPALIRSFAQDASGGVNLVPEESFDFAIIGAGGAGEAAAHMARARGASVAVIDRELFGGSCPFWVHAVEDPAPRCGRACERGRL